MAAPTGHRLPLLGALLVSALFFTTSHAKTGKWSYEGEAGPEMWSQMGYHQCSGERQSPINVVTNRVIQKDFKPIEFVNFNQIPLKMNLTNNYHSAKAVLEWEEVPQIESAGLPGKFKVINYHFHWGKLDYKGSEHTIDGESYPLELHIVCQNTKYENLSDALQNLDGLAVMGIMFEVSGGNNRALKRLEPALKKIVDGGSTAVVEEPPRLLELMPWNTNDFFRYDGSLTTPSCNEVVTWTVFLESVKITPKQLALFRSLKTMKEDAVPIGNNYRPPQHRFGRSVFLSKPGEFQREDQPALEALKLKGAADSVAVSAAAGLLTLLTALLIGR